MRKLLATAVSIYGLYDCHCFEEYEGSTVDEVISNWLEHISQPQPAIVGGHKMDDIGPTYLCPAIVVAGNKELRRVGTGVDVDYLTRKPRNAEDLENYRAALLADPDIPRLLAARKGGSHGKD